MTRPDLTAEELDATIEWVAGRLRSCGWCGRAFVANTSRHIYHRSSCQVMAARARRRARERAS